MNWRTDKDLDELAKQPHEHQYVEEVAMGGYRRFKCVFCGYRRLVDVHAMTKGYKPHKPACPCYLCANGDSIV